VPHLRGKVVLVSGGTQGVGAGVARAASREGTAVAVLGRIRINGVDIGWTDTEGEDAIQREFHGADDGWREQAARALPMGRLGRVDEIAEFIVFLLSDRSGVVTGSVLDWDQIVFGAHD
jgi:NAD(P)-dependent dehydrogenase (short-subunit alcohol dehydrogenase family)